MTSDTSSEVYDLFILVDATESMSSYLHSLKTSLPKIIAISDLTNSFSRNSLLAYHYYTETDRENGGLLEWSGWVLLVVSCFAKAVTCSRDLSRITMPEPTCSQH